MSLRMENVRFDNRDFYSILYNPDGRDRLVIQTSDKLLARQILERGCTDGYQIPKEFLERQS